LRQCPSRYAIRAGRNFTLIRCFQRRRLSLHLFHQEGRRLMELIDLSCDRSLHLGLSTSVVTGSRSCCSRLPTGLPARGAGASPLLAGFAREIALSRGRFRSTRQGISLILLLVDLLGARLPSWRVDHFCRPPYVAAGIGPSLLLLMAQKRAGVWSLRILSTSDGFLWFIVSVI
jgi:hypothetical protein